MPHLEYFIFYVLFYIVDFITVGMYLFYKKLKQNNM